jgi:hypothetical protein
MPSAPPGERTTCPSRLRPPSRRRRPTLHAPRPRPRPRHQINGMSDAVHVAKMWPSAQVRTHRSLLCVTVQSTASWRKRSSARARGAATQRVHTQLGAFRVSMKTASKRRSKRYALPVAHAAAAIMQRTRLVIVFEGVLSAHSNLVVKLDAAPHGRQLRRRAIAEAARRGRCACRTSAGVRAKQLAAGHASTDRFGFKHRRMRASANTPVYGARTSLSGAAASLVGRTCAARWRRSAGRSRATGSVQCQSQARHLQRGPRTHPLRRCATERSVSTCTRAIERYVGQKSAPGKLAICTPERQLLHARRPGGARARRALPDARQLADVRPAVAARCRVSAGARGRTDAGRKVQTNQSATHLRIAATLSCVSVSGRIAVHGTSVSSLYAAFHSAGAALLPRASASASATTGKCRSAAARQHCASKRPLKRLRAPGTSGAAGYARPNACVRPDQCVRVLTHASCVAPGHARNAREVRRVPCW